MDLNGKGTQSLHRLLDLMETLAAFPKGISLMELSEKCGLPKSTVHRMLGCLLERNYVYQNPATGEYSLSLKLFALSASVQQTDLLAVAKPHLDRLSEKLRETVHFVIMDNTDVVYLYKKVPLDRLSQMSSIIGARSPMYRTAVGKAILSTMTPAEVESIWNGSTIEKKTSKTITDFEELRRELDLIGENGYAIDNEENELGIKCVAFPLVAPGLTPSAFSVSGLSPQMTASRIKSIAPLAREVQLRIYHDLGIGF
jgi:DNA-binding IclR family transcriptional regulator